jgi:hypothetical protein
MSIQPGFSLFVIIMGLKIELAPTLENLPSPLFAKEGYFLPLARGG